MMRIDPEIKKEAQLIVRERAKSNNFSHILQNNSLVQAAAN